MAENLTAADVSAYTKGRLSEEDDEVVRALNEALARARRYCGWHVSPIRSETLMLNGDGGYELFLPTLKIGAITEITIDGEPIDLSTVKRDAEAPGVLIRYCWPCGFSNITVTLTHGYTATEAQDWRGAVLRMIDQASQSVGQQSISPMTQKKVDDVEYHWSDRVQYTSLDATALSQYRLLAL